MYKEFCKKMEERFKISSDILIRIENEIKKIHPQYNSILTLEQGR